MKLSVLIASLKSRNDLFIRVFETIQNQINSNNYDDIVEVITFVDNGEISIGEKRNKLKSQAKGEYICFVDDDDLLPNYYLKEIVGRLNNDYDLINFYVEHIVDGNYKKLICPNTSIDSIDINGCMFWINMLHLCPHKKTISDLVQFPNINFCEDLEYSRQLKNHIKNTFFIEKIMYHYDFKSNK